MIRIDRDAYKFIATLLFIGAACFVLYLLSGSAAPLAGTVLCVIGILYCAYFFRDPDRSVPNEPGVLISPADGLIVDIADIDADGFENGTARRIAVFMNVFNVHVNRSPMDGRVAGLKHRNGKKLSAYNKRAEYENEHSEIDFVTEQGPVRVRQIAGLVARRVVTRLEPGDTVERGGRIGLIRFGSRVDVLFPTTFTPAVQVGEKTRAGETVIARYTMKPEG